jgi:two-component system, OmpR family, response regulator
MDGRLLVVEDDPQVRAMLARALGYEGFEVTCVPDAAGAMAGMRTADPELMLLDLLLPDEDGLEVCRRLREFSDAYVIMLTGRPDEVDRLIGLETGADDYVTKPFSPRELSARVAALMRRPRRMATAAPAEEQPSVHRLGGLQVDPDGRIATLDGAELDLTRTEFDLLATMFAAPRRVWARETLLRAVWGSDWVSDGHLVEVHMGNLRRKLGDDPRSGRYIRTVRGVGYRLGSG